MNSLVSSITPSGFRDWLDVLNSIRGRRPLWPVVLGLALDREFRRQCESSEKYSGTVFIDRDSHELDEGEREERLVARLYRNALANDGCVHLERLPIWLLGFQWPTQGGLREKKRQADLVGLTAQGGLVVFEAKAASGGDPPLFAICEGLDYLACLLRPGNFAQIEKRFDSWRRKPEKVVPDGFEDIRPSLLAKPKLVVLAPEGYYSGRHARSIRSRDWPLIADCGESFMPSVDLHFAATDFSSTSMWEPRRPDVT